MGGDEKGTSMVVGDTTESAPGLVGGEVVLSGCVSDDRPSDENVVEAEGDCANAGGGQGLSEEIADEEEEGQQAQGERQEERPTREVEQDDPFADEDDDKENRDPQVVAPVVEHRVDGNPAEELSVFDESSIGLGVDLMEEVLDF